MVVCYSSWASQRFDRKAKAARRKVAPPTVDIKGAFNDVLVEKVIGVLLKYQISEAQVKLIGAFGQDQFSFTMVVSL